MKSSHHPSAIIAIPRNSFRRTLLRPLLHNFSALPPVNHSDGITYRQLFPKSRKSFRRLLLPLFVPVSPLGAHSYKKMGGTPLPRMKNSILHSSAPTRPCLTPLFSTLSAKPYTFPPLSKPFEFNQFQTSWKSPLSNSFRMIAFQKCAFFFRHIATVFVRTHSFCVPVVFVGRSAAFKVGARGLTDLKKGEINKAPRGSTGGSSLTSRQHGTTDLRHERHWNPDAG